jgi:aminoglycoside phosphotransferase
MSTLPANLTQLISGYSWETKTYGFSTSEVFLLTKPGTENLFLKMAPLSAEQFLLAEKQRLEWLGQRLPAPQVRFFEQDANREYLLITEIAGTDATDKSLAQDMATLVRLLAQGLGLIHSLPADGCPFDHTLNAEIERANFRLTHNLVNEADFDVERQGRKATDLFARLLAARPVNEDLVFTHGDYCLPNIIIQQGRISGFVDWGRGGIGDRYRDLALAARSLAYNCGDEWVALLFAEYGLKEPDQSKIDFFMLLDEFF